MLTLDLVSPLFTEEKSKYYILSIQISLDGLSISIRDYLSNSFLALQTIPRSEEQELEAFVTDICTNNAKLQLAFRQSFVLFNTAGYATIPEHFYKEGAEKSFYQLNANLSDNDELIKFKHSDLHLYSVFAVNASLSSFLRLNFPNVHFLHSQDVNIWSGQLLDNTIEEQVVLEIFEKSFNITAFSNAQFTFHNTFNYQTTEDFVFFILNVLKQVDFENETVSVIIRGCIERNAEELAFLRKFVPNIQFDALPISFHYSDIVYQNPSHYYTNLFLAQQCE